MSENSSLERLRVDRPPPLPSSSVLISPAAQLPNSIRSVSVAKAPAVTIDSDDEGDSLQKLKFKRLKSRERRD